MPRVLAYGRQSINEGDIEVVGNVLRLNFLEYISSSSTFNRTQI